MSKYEDYLKFKDRAEKIKQGLNGFGRNGDVYVEAQVVDAGSFDIRIRNCGYFDTEGVAVTLADYIRQERCRVADAAIKHIDQELEKTRRAAAAELKEVMGDEIKEILAGPEVTD